MERNKSLFMFLYSRLKKKQGNTELKQGRKQTPLRLELEPELYCSVYTFRPSINIHIWEGTPRRYRLYEDVPLC